MKIIITAVLFVSAFTAYKYFNKPKAALLPKINYMSCQGHSFDSQVKLQSSFYLSNKALPTNAQELNALLESAAFVQNLYTFTNISQINVQGPLTWSSLGNRPKIKILKIEDAAYPFNADFETELPLIGMTQPMINYLTKLLSFGEVKQAEPAKKVTYEYENNLKFCLKENNFATANTLKFIQPKDAFLAYFVVPKIQRRLIYNPIVKASATINPCMFNEAVTAGGVAPFAFWYHWNPELKGTDHNKGPFDCTLYYQNEKTINLVNVTLTENAPKKVADIDFEKFNFKDRPLNVSVQFGPQENTDFYPLDAKAEEYINLYLTKLDPHQVRKGLPIENGAKYDVTFNRVLVFLWSLNQHFDVIQKNIETTKYHVSIELKGKLRLSKKDMQINITYGRNLPGLEGSEYFEKNFSRDLLSKDILIYDGHASYGGIFTNVFEEMKKLPDNKDNLNYQILALYSCSSGHYFDAQMFKKLKTPGFRRDIISTGGGFRDSTSNASLALIASLDGYLYNERYVPFAYWATSFKTDNFLILTND